MTKSRILKAIITVTMMMFFTVGCNKSDDPNNGSNNGNNNNDVRVTIYSPQDITATTVKCGGDVIVTQGLSLTELGVCWSKEHNPTADQPHLSTTVWNEPFVCTIANLEPETRYYVRAYVLRGLEYYYSEEKSFCTTEDNGIGIYNGYKYVDLGLPSGTLWAIYNVGANTPEGYGDYYAWGETELKMTYGWSTYKYSEGDSHLTKYCCSESWGLDGYMDNLTTLLPEDDAATINWGNGWCIPTENQWSELNEYTSFSWTSQNGVKGGLFTATNGHSLFLPAAGDQVEQAYLVGDRGWYWSSSLFLPRNYSAIRNSFDKDSLNLGWGARGVGGSIRPVCFKK